MKILIIDDDEIALSVAKKILESDGYEVELADGGERLIFIQGYFIRLGPVIPPAYAEQDRGDEDKNRYRCTCGAVIMRRRIIRLMNRGCLHLLRITIWRFDCLYQ